MNARPIDAPHDMLLPGTRSELEREFFCRSLTNYLETQARPRLRELYDREVAPALRRAWGTSRRGATLPMRCASSPPTGSGTRCARPRSACPTRPVPRSSSGSDRS